MLALRFCIPPSASFGAMADFFAEGKILAQLELDATLNAEFNLQFGTDISQLEPGDRTPGWAEQLNGAADDGGNPIFSADPNFVNALLVGTDPKTAVLPAPLPLESKPDDPLCSS